MSIILLEADADLFRHEGGDDDDDDVPLTGKEVRKAKLLRSRSLSSQPTTSKPLNPDRQQ